MKKCRCMCLPLLAASLLQAAEYHVAPAGNDTHSGAENAPCHSIQHAANLAQPGDTITVHEGVYRERVNPPRGGTSDAMRIVYQAAPGEKVVIKGSEPVKGWVKEQHDTWRVVIPNKLFGGFNPYADVIGGEWYNTPGWDRHTGAVYLNENLLTE